MHVREAFGDEETPVSAGRSPVRRAALIAALTAGVGLAASTLVPAAGAEATAPPRIQINTVGTTAHPQADAATATGRPQCHGGPSAAP